MALIQYVRTKTKMFIILYTKIFPKFTYVQDHFLKENVIPFYYINIKFRLLYIVYGELSLVTSTAVAILHSINVDFLLNIFFESPKLHGRDKWTRNQNNYSKKKFI